MIVLDLFAGTKSVQRALDKLRLNYEYISLDNNPKFDTTYQVDILEFDYRSLEIVPDIIWASIPCLTWSKASNAYRLLPDLIPKNKIAEEANEQVYKTLEIIQYFLQRNPKLIFFIENPKGRLRHFPIMKSLHRYTIDYCQYNETECEGKKIKKPTDIWSNLLTWRPKPLCKVKGHIRWDKGRGNKIERSKVPTNLIVSLLEKMLENQT